MKSSLIFQSYWLIPVCLLMGAAYAWLLYSRKTTLSRNTNLILAVLRAILVSLICFVLLNPLLKSITNRTLKPVVLLAVDDSASMNVAGKDKLTELKKFINKIQEELGDSDFELVIQNIGGENLNSINSLNFTGKKTDLGSFFRNTTEQFDGGHLSKVILVSDGIVNSGISPLLRNYAYSIETIGTGDTTVKKDISINGVIANKLAYLGNSFPLQVEIESDLFAGKSTTVQISHNSEVIDRKIVTFPNDDSFQTVSFNLEAKDIGKQLYQVSVLPLGGEANIRNNSRDVLIDIIDGKEKVLIVSAAPHPDLKAMRAIMEKNELFEVETAILNSGQNVEGKEFDILILHQLPDIRGTGTEMISRLLGKLKPTLFVLGSQTDLSRFNGMQQVIGINGQNGRIDKITGTLHTGFNRFMLNEAYSSTLDKLPPLSSPFGEYQTMGGTDVILFQKVGSITTERPLLAVNTNSARKSAVMAASGLWQWRLEEFLINESQEAVDDLFLKTLQIIAVKESKDKLRVYPVRDEFDTDESVILQNEAYNDLYERIYDFKVELTLRKNKEQPKTYTYDVSESASRFELSKLAAGVYTYIAKSQIQGKLTESSGQFVVKDQNLEFLNTRADFDFLRTLSSRNGGEFYELNEGETLLEKLKSQNIPSKIISTDSLREIVNLKWLLLFLIALATAEWVTRKYFGTY